MSDRDEEREEELPEVEDGDETLPLDQTQEPGDGDLDGAAPNHTETVEEESDTEDALPPSKPWSGTFRMLIPLSPELLAAPIASAPSSAAAPAAQLSTVKVAKDDNGFPEWLHFVLNDDFAHFERAIYPPPPKKPKKKAVNGGATGDDEGAGEGDALPEVEAPPADDTGAEGGEEESDHEGKFVPNRLLYLHQARDGTFILRSRPDDDEPRSQPASSPSPSTANPVGEGDANDDSAAGAGEGDELDPVAAAAAAAAQQEASAASAAASKNATIVLPLDYVTLAMCTSQEALALMLGVQRVSVDRALQWASAVAGSNADVLTPLLQALVKAKTASDDKKEQKESETRKKGHNHPTVHKLSTDLGWLFHSLVAFPRLNATIQRQVTLLSGLGVTPKAPLDVEKLLVTPDAALLYLNVLLHMPRSQLTLWTQPTPQDGDDPIDDETRKAKPLSPALGQILLDLRRRAIRRRHGKGPLRVKASTVYRPILATYSAVLEAGANATSAAITAALANGQDLPKGQDVALSQQYSAKRDGTQPTSLALFESDLLLLLLGGANDETYGEGVAEDLAPLFESLLLRRCSALSKARKRNNVDKKADDTSADGTAAPANVEDIASYRPALWHLLFQHLHTLTPPCVTALFRHAPMRNVLFAPLCGVARVQDFSERYCYEYDGRFAETSVLACEEAVERNQFFLKHYAKSFCAKFWPELTSSEATMMTIERQGSSFLSVLLAPSMEYSRIVRAIAAKPPLPEDQLLSRLEQLSAPGFANTAHPQTIFHPELMGVAVDCQNYAAVQFLAKRHGVVTSCAGPYAAEVELVDEALRRCDLNLLRVVVIECGAKLNAILHRGLTSGLVKLQDLGSVTSENDAVTEANRQTEDAMHALIADWRRVEAERLSDPLKHHGLLLALPAAAVSSSA